jgi:hypothetical protein
MTNRQNKPHCAVVNNFRRNGCFHLLDVDCDTGVKWGKLRLSPKWEHITRTLAVAVRRECGGMGNKQPPRSHLTWWQRRPPSTCTNDAQAGTPHVIKQVRVFAPPS